MRRYLLLIPLTLSVLACATPFAADPCAPDNLEETIAPLDEKDVEFADAVDVANSTPRMSLAEPIATMQEVRRDTAQLEVPECAADMQAALVAYMDAEVEAILAFLSQESDTALLRKMTDAEEARLEYLETVLLMAGEITEEPN